MRQPLPGNPIVFLDFQIGKERVGKMVIELRKDCVPRTAENFRRICVGDFISPSSKRRLSYTGTRIHRVQRIFAICGGKLGAGTSDESIYGPGGFEDENFELRHEVGAVSMSNSGPNTNNSQFFITRTDCPNLDGTHVVFGHVLRGFDIIPEMEKVTTEEGTPTTEIVILNAGELDADEARWGFYDIDDGLPPFPSDWSEATEEHMSGDPEAILRLLERIKSLGNAFFNNQEEDIVPALRKYKKVGRYHQFFVDAAGENSDRLCASEQLAKLRLNNLLNMAACHLKLGQYQHAIVACDEVIRSSPNQSKAYYRRAVAEIEMKEYDRALKDLSTAHSLAPHDPHVLQQFNRGKQLLLEYRKEEKAVSQKIFKELNL